MSRNGSGTYTLPSGNPVVSGTLIEASWANTTLSDLASAMTDSLSRSGQGGMTAALRLFDGTSSVPGLAWGSETTTGWYRAGAGDMRLVITGSQVIQYLSTGVAVTGTLSVSGNTTLSGGTANGVPYLNGSKVLTTGSALTFDGTNLGVGVASPLRPLDVLQRTNDTTPAVLLRGYTTGADGARTVLMSTVSSDANNWANLAISAQSHIWQYQGSEQMRLTSTGLGIGTSSPAARLQVTASSSSGTSGADGARFNAGGNVAINIGADSSSGYGWIQSANWGSGYISTAINPNGGNVGIGTSSPAQRLDVQGSSSPTIRVRNTSAATSNFSQLLLETANTFSGVGNAYLRAISMNAGNSSTALAFGVNADGGGAPFEAARITPGGSLLVGPGAVDDSGRMTISGANGYSGNGLSIYETSTGNARRLRMSQESSGFVYNATWSTGGNAHIWQIGGSEAARIDVNSNLLVGTSSKLGGGLVGIDINNASPAGITFGVSGTARAYLYTNPGISRSQWETASGYTIAVVSGGSGGVSLANGATSWSALSDERHKDIIEPIADAASKVANLRAVIGKYKTDEDGMRRAFLIAQDVQAVLPEAVDSTDTENLALRYLDLTPLLVAAIQEQQAIIEQLKADVAALKGA